MAKQIIIPLTFSTEELDRANLSVARLIERNFNLKVELMEVAGVDLADDSKELLKRVEDLNTRLKLYEGTKNRT